MSLVFSKPDFTDVKKTKQWYTDNIRYISTKYNVRAQIVTERVDDVLENPVDEALRMYTYYIGRQQNRDYTYSNQKADGTEHTKWVPGQKLASLIDYMLGVGIKLVDSFKINIEATSKAAYNQKTSMIEQAMLRYKLKPQFDEIAELGVNFNPMGAADIQSEEELEEVIESYKDESEQLAYELAEDIRLRNDYDSLAKGALFHTLLGGAIGIEHTVANKKQWQEVVPFYDLIWDSSEEKDVHKKDKFVGRIYHYTPEEFLHKYSDWLEPEEIDIIKRINNQNYNEILPSDGMFQWVKIKNNQPLIIGIKGYWVGFKDLPYKEKTDKYGNTHMSKKREEKGGFKTMTVYKGILAGGKFIVDYGEQKNIVRNISNRGDAELPIKVFSPGAVLGEVRSFASKLHNLQDRIDFYENEIIKMVNQAKGKKHIIHKNKLGSDSSKQVLSDFEDLGFHVSDGEQDGEGQSRERMVEVVDMTLDPNVQSLVILKQEQERMMEEIINTSKIALGQQSGYVGAKTQAASISQSSYGTLNFYTSFVRFIENCLQYGTNQYKVCVSSQSEDEIPLIGERGVKYAKITEDFTFEDFRVYIKVIDIISDEAKARLVNIALAFVQNGMLDPLDYIEIEKAKTYTDLLKTLRVSLQKKKKEQEKQAMMQQMMAQAIEEQKNAGKINEREMIESGQNYRKNVDAEVKVATSQPAQEAEAVPA